MNFDLKNVDWKTGIITTATNIIMLTWFIGVTMVMVLALIGIIPSVESETSKLVISLVVLVGGCGSMLIVPARILSKNNTRLI